MARFPRTGSTTEFQLFYRLKREAKALGAFPETSPRHHRPVRGHVDFGAAFTGSPRWLEIRAGKGAPFCKVHTTPRQALTPAERSLRSFGRDGGREREHHGSRTAR